MADFVREDCGVFKSVGAGKEVLIEIAGRNDESHRRDVFSRSIENVKSREPIGADHRAEIGLAAVRDASNVGRVPGARREFDEWISREGIGLLAFGFAARERSLRLSGLTTLLICVGKVFFYDLRNLETLYRIFSFVGLGAILLLVSWIYTRFKEQLRKYL